MGYSKNQNIVMINYHNKKFRVIENTDNGETDSTTVFTYHQIGNILTCSYKGREIVSGHLIGIVDKEGKINMHYHQINKSGDIMTGTCNSTPEILENGKIRLHESWQWTSGDRSSGKSVLDEC